MKAPWAIYTRLSFDRTGEQTATARQERACRQFAAVRGWVVGAVYEDVDVSAYKPGTARPSYLRLLADVETGAVGGVLVWKLDRLMRRAADFELFWTRCERAGVALASATEPIDTSTELGMAVVRILITFAQLESATRAVRLASKCEEMARQGRRHSGGCPGYGYNADMSVNRYQAARIREAAGRVLTGHSLASIARDWNRRGIPGHLGGRWTVTTLKRLLTAPRLVGDRAYHGEVVATDCWAPVLGRLTAARVSTALGEARGRPRPRSVNARTLLAELVYCQCGERAHGTRLDHQGGYLATRCPAGHVSVGTRELNDTVTELLFQRFPGTRVPDAVRPPVHRSEMVAIHEAHVARLAQLADDYYRDRLIDRPGYLRRRDALIVSFEAERRSLETPPLEEFTADPRYPLRVRWLGMSFRDRRKLVRDHIARVVVHPGHGANVFDSSRLEVTWWERAGDATWSLRTERLGREEPGPGGWLSEADAAALAGGLNVRTFHDLLAAGLTTRRVRKHPWYRREEVEALVESCRIGPGFNRRVPPPSPAAGPRRRPRRSRDGRAVDTDATASRARSGTSRRSARRPRS